MDGDFLELPAPRLTPPGHVTAERISHGPTIPPPQRILLYSADEWEAFVHEWAHFSLKTKYLQLQRFSGPGDRGIDIAGFTDAKKLLGVWDNYQCKRFLNHAIYPGDVWPDIGKILWHSYKAEYCPPRRYYFVSPKGVGTTLAGYLANASKLKNTLLQNWDEHVRNAITATREIALEGDFLHFVQQFDFAIFDSKTALQLVEDHRACPYHSIRFGGGLPARPEVQPPPCAVAATESRYIEQLLCAYADHLKQQVMTSSTLKEWPKLNGHFSRQREAFYHAESLRVFARDSVPSGTFENLQDDIHAGVIDICDSDHVDGFTCVKRVTQAARDLQLTANALVCCTRPKDRDGICHQLANEDRLKWLKS
jgi:hypothetical protein